MIENQVQFIFKTICSFCLVLTLVVGVYGQSPVELELGAQAGVPFTVPLESLLTGPAGTYSSQAYERSAFSVGPAVAVVIHERIAVEFDALYKPIKFTSSSASISTSTRGGSWEFPLIANYRFLSGPIRPFGGGGMLLGASLFGTTETENTDNRTGVVTVRSDPFRAFFSQLPAYIVNGGLEWRSSHVSIRPELRFTRWSGVDQSASDVRKQNQFEYLLGFSFRGFKR